MKSEILDQVILTVIVLIVVAIIGSLYYVKMKRRTTEKNQCPCCHQNYGQRIQTPFIYKILQGYLK